MLEKGEEVEMSEEVEEGEEEVHKFEAEAEPLCRPCKHPLS